MNAKFSSLTFFFLCVFCAHGLSDDVSKEEFLKEAKKGWLALKERYGQGYSSDSVCQSGSPSEYPDGVDSKNSTTISHEYRLLGRMEMFNSIRKNKKILTCINRDYGFVLKCEDGEMAWTISSFLDNPASMRMEKQEILRGSMGVFEGIMVEGDWLESLVFSKDFQILSIEADDVGGQRGQKVVFQSRYDVDDHNKILAGSLWFDSDYFWVLREYQIELQSDSFGVASKKIHYCIWDGVPYPEKITLDYEFAGDPPIRYVSTYKSISNSCDPSVFYLSHYGFSEPVDATRRISNVHVVLTVIGILLIAIGLYMRYLVSKKL